MVSLCLALILCYCRPPGRRSAAVHVTRCGTWVVSMLSERSMVVTASVGVDYDSCQHQSVTPGLARGFCCAGCTRNLLLRLQPSEQTNKLQDTTRSWNEDDHRS